MVREQVTRMETTVAHQLSRAAAARLTLPAPPLPLLPTAARVTRALRHAYAEKGVAVEAPWETAEPELDAYAVRVDERDALEMLGNLIENAFKYTRSRVRISAALTPGGVATTVEDDGDGIPESMRERVLRRGVRADAATTGQGIGLAVGGGNRHLLRRPVGDREQRSGRRRGASGTAGRAGSGWPLIAPCPDQQRWPASAARMLRHSGPARCCEPNAKDDAGKDAAASGCPSRMRRGSKASMVAREKPCRLLNPISATPRSALRSRPLLDIATHRSPSNPAHTYDR